MRRPEPSWTMRGATPFLDLLFLLLFSLLALSDTRRATATEAVKIRLPRVVPTEEEAGESSRSTIVLEIDGDSNVRLAGNPAVLGGPEHLDRLLAERLGPALPETFEVEIQADGRARHGVSVALLQHLRRRGFGGVTLLALGDRDATWAEEGR